jgi:hypothetical protein
MFSLISHHETVSGMVFLGKPAIPGNRFHRTSAVPMSVGTPIGSNLGCCIEDREDYTWFPEAPD